MRDTDDRPPFFDAQGQRVSVSDPKSAPGKLKLFLAPSEGTGMKWVNREKVEFPTDDEVKNGEQNNQGAGQVHNYAGSDKPHQEIGSRAASRARTN